jgi:rhamnulokinase
MTPRRYLAFDLGAESGRAVVGTLADGRLALEEIHRFANEPIEVCDTLHWDILALYGHVLKGMREYARRYGNEVAGIGLDTWGVDFGLLGRDGKLLQNPVHYRDRRTEGMVERALTKMPAKALYGRTGMALLPIQTLFQLLSLQVSSSPVLESATRLLMIPDLLGYFLAGEQAGERSDAITTQLYDPRTGQWDEGIFQAFGLPMAIMPSLVDPGTVLGNLRASVRQTAGLGHTPVIAVCNHDTGSAVAAVPGAGDDWASISSGTWSVLGALSAEVVTSPEAFAARACTELTLGSLFLCRNIMGLWLLQQAREAWQRRGREYSYEELVRLAEEAPASGPLIHPDDLGFLAPPDMPQAIRDFCARTGQAPPEGPAETTRCVLESLALSYREGLEGLAQLLGRRFGVIHIVGGGSRNRLLCQLTADATGLPVLAGPAEATVAGNVLVQALALGALSSPAEVREVVRRSSDLVEYVPHNTDFWEARYGAYQRTLPAMGRPK